jgi:hypothetical protein
MDSDTIPLNFSEFILNVMCKNVIFLPQFIAAIVRLGTVQYLPTCVWLWAQGQVKTKVSLNIFCWVSDIWYGMFHCVKCRMMLESVKFEEVSDRVLSTLI